MPLSVKITLLSLIVALSGCPITVDKPTGPYGIGSVTVALQDDDRMEEMTQRADDNRRLMLEFWYPTAPSDSLRLTKYVEIIPKIVHSVTNADLSNDKQRWPLVILSHGLAGNRNHSEFLSESLVSQGYLVAGIDHAFYSGPVVFPDGFQAGNLLYMLRFTAPFMTPALLNKYFAVWLADCHFVIRSIQQINQDPTSPFYQRIDTQRIAIVGHSFGGGMGIQCAKENEAVVASLSMDGVPHGSVKELGTDKPFMLIWPGQNEANEVSDRFDHGLFKLSPTFYWASIANTVHGDFTDLNRVVNSKGSPNINRKQEITNTFVHAFLARHLLGEPSPLLDGVGIDKFPEVKFSNAVPEDNSEGN